MSFPERVYTIDEVQKARALIKKGWKHRLQVKGDSDFKRNVEEALALIKTAGYYDFLRTYIREIVEIEGFSQLREAEAAIWVDKVTLSDIIDAASLFIQKAQQMKDFLEGRLYYGQGETRAIKTRLEFLEALKRQAENGDVKKRCEEKLKKWAESTFF
ncbi:MAG: hypothetical protein ACUVT5_00295 [Candidatus Bathyarchaeales archaeon]